jgi:hypothetical protein
MGNQPLLKLRYSPPQRDFTDFVPADPDGKGRIEMMLSTLNPPRSAATTYSVDCSTKLECDDGGCYESVRVVACKCFVGQRWSVTIRVGGKQVQSTARPDPPETESRFKIKPEYLDHYFTSLSITCEVLYQEISSQLSRRTGLLVVTGATSSGKSEITRGLIELRMQDAVEEHKKNPAIIRRPHLITFEDPIEKFYNYNSLEQPRHFDYTPRAKKIDAPTLKWVFKDALRQTPSLVFVGEIRDPREWIDVLEFASTGHSVIATAHAGSLAESWGKILAALNVSTPAGRSDVVNKILGIVHLRSFSLEKKLGVIPALWRYTPTGAMAFVADGRSSLLPLLDPPTAEESSLGRTQFQRLIVAAMKKDLEASCTKSRSLNEADSDTLEILSTKIRHLEDNKEFEQLLLRADLEGL